MATGKGGGRRAKPQTATSPRPSLSSVPVITLLTDFGLADHFVAAMKGVILSMNRQVSIVDITHQISPQDIPAAAFTILAAHDVFPSGTIHVAIVDPGVGSDRSALVIEAGGQFFVGPDNGIFSYICERYEHVVRAIINSKLFRQPVSSTFQGRDVFAPVAAAIASGVRIGSLGPRVNDWVRLPSLIPSRTKDGKLRGRIIHIDQFGNCITNFTPAELPEPAKSKLIVKGKWVSSFRRFFAEGAREEVFAYWGSAGFLELGVKGGSAAKILMVRAGDPVIANPA